MAIDLQPYIDAQPELAGIFKGQPGFWLNPFMKATEQEIWENERLGLADIKAADANLRRYAPLIAALFPETKPTNGIIESALEPIPQMRARLASMDAMRQRRPPPISDEDTRLFREAIGEVRRIDADTPVAQAARPAPYPHMRDADEAAVSGELLSSWFDPGTMEIGEDLMSFFIPIGESD